jgi:hypothetical protein
MPFCLLRENVKRGNKRLGKMNISAEHTRFSTTIVAAGPGPHLPNPDEILLLLSCSCPHR